MSLEEKAGEGKKDSPSGSRAAAISMSMLDSLNATSDERRSLLVAEQEGRETSWEDPYLSSVLSRKLVFAENPKSG